MQTPMTDQQVIRLERQIQALKFALKAVLRILWAMQPDQRKQIESILNALDTVQPSREKR